MNLPGVSTLRRAAWRLQKYFASQAIILMYHSIAEVDSDPWALRVTPTHFAEHLEILQKYATPIRLRQLVQMHREQTIPNRTVVITFDDGYADNLYEAKPLLERYDVPATIFLTTGHIGCEREFWWDELERVLLEPGTLPEKLCLTIDNHTREWELEESAIYGKKGEAQSQYQEEIGQKRFNSRLSLYYSIWQTLLPLSYKVRQKALDEIIRWAGAEANSRFTHRTLSPDEVCTLEQGNLIDIGAHTITHPFLSAHPISFQRNEIQQCKIYLEEILGHPLTSFSYPHGDYTAETIALLQEAGFTCACSVEAGSVWRKTDPFQLPRFEVQNWNGGKFTNRLRKWLRS
jgi:peptidoglycan/xylan/chitin deacetylase (PgdA/CDA1 family)